MDTAVVQELRDQVTGLAAELTRVQDRLERAERLLATADINVMITPDTKHLAEQVLLDRASLLAQYTP
jgi:hypothetical protein